MPEAKHRLDEPWPKGHRCNDKADVPDCYCRGSKAPVCRLCRVQKCADKTPWDLCNEVWTSQKALEEEAVKNKKKYVKPTASSVHEKDDDVTDTIDGKEESVSVRYKLKCYDLVVSPGGSAIECKFKSQGPGGFSTLKGQEFSAETRYECIDGRPLAGSCSKFVGALILADKSCVEKAKSPSKTK